MEPRRENKDMWCDMYCEYARFPKNDKRSGANSCRTFDALWCEKYNQYVLKNDRCINESQ